MSSSCSGGADLAAQSAGNEAETRLYSPQKEDSEVLRVILLYRQCRVVRIATAMRDARARKWSHAWRKSENRCCIKFTLD